VSATLGLEPMLVTRRVTRRARLSGSFPVSPRRCRGCGVPVISLGSYRVGVRLRASESDWASQLSDNPQDVQLSVGYLIRNAVRGVSAIIVGGMVIAFSLLGAL
jgi:hypothetical protein